MVKILSIQQVENLIQIESQIHYSEPPPYEVLPFTIINRGSPILLSAPHGCRTFRNRNGKTWHEEDEYTAGMALLLSELCQVSVIATVWRTDDSDPNDTKEIDEKEYRSSPYKIAVRNLCKQGIRWLIDLHGASENSERMAPTQLVDLGAGKGGNSIPKEHLNILRETIEKYLGQSATYRNGLKGWDASMPGRSITAFAQQDLKVNAVQLEMKPVVRVAQRHVDATMYGKPLSDGGGPYTAPVNKVLGMMQAITDFIVHLKGLM
jgi:hypothetical protein